MLQLTLLQKITASFVYPGLNHKFDTYQGVFSGKSKILFRFGILVDR